MTALRVKAFRGQVPRTSDRLIGENYAVTALNCKITAGRLDPLKGLLLSHTSLQAGIQTIYRYRFNNLDSWLVWPSVVDVVKSPTVQDSLGRIFYTGDGEPRMTVASDAISGAGPFPTVFYTLGVYSPDLAPALVVAGGSAPVETRSYVYTFKTRFSEESAPSLPVQVSGNANGSWNLSGMETAPPNNGSVTSAVTIATGIVELTLNTVRGLSVHEQIVFAGITGMTVLNGKHTILQVTPTTNKLTVGINTAQTYTGGGTWARSAQHNVTAMTKVIYRQAGTNADYRRVDEIPAAQTTYNDTIGPVGVALNEILPTLTSDVPPKNGHSLTALANGALFMIAGNQGCFSEQYKPYSWPLESRYNFFGQGVAACAAGNSVIVLTDGYPVVITATVPETASLARLPTYAPCISKRGAVDVGGGCLFPSHDGLYLATPSDAKNITDPLYRIDEWQTRMPGSFIAAYHDQKYYAMHTGTTTETARILVLDMSEADSITEVDERVDSLYANPLDGKFYAVQGNLIKEWDADDTNRYLMFWEGRENQLGAAINFSFGQVHAKYAEIVPPDTSIIAANQALLANANNIENALGMSVLGMFPFGATNLLDAAPVTQNRVQFSLVKDGSVVFTQELDSSAPFRIDSGYKSEVYAIQITASIPVYSIGVAQGARELIEVSQ